MSERISGNGPLLAELEHVGPPKVLEVALEPVDEDWEAIRRAWLIQQQMQGARMPHTISPNFWVVYAERGSARETGASLVRLMNGVRRSNPQTYQNFNLIHIIYGEPGTINGGVISAGGLDLNTFQVEDLRYQLAIDTNRHLELVHSPVKIPVR